MRLRRSDCVMQFCSIKYKEFFIHFFISLYVSLFRESNLTIRKQNLFYQIREINCFEKGIINLLVTVESQIH